MKKQFDNKLFQFGKRVRQLRLDAGLTQEDLAAKANCDSRTIQNIEAGDTNVTLRKIYSLAEALNVKACDLL